MTSRFRLQIVDTTHGDVVEWEPGLKVETDFVTDCIARILARGVGLFRTSDHVAQDINDGIEEAIYELKKKITPKHQIED